MPDIEIPSSVTFEKLNEIVIGWYRSKAHEKLVQLSDVSGRIGMNPTTISRQNAFLQDMGFLQKEGQQFRLSPQGAEYAKFLDFGQLEEAKRVLRETLLQWKGFQQIYDYLDLKGPLTKNELANRIGLAADKKPSGGTRTGIYAIIEFLIFAELAIDRDSALTYNRERPSHTPVSLSKEVPRPTHPLPVPDTKIECHTSYPLNVQIKIVLDNNLEPAKLEDALKVIRKVFTEDKD